MNDVTTKPAQIQTDGQVFVALSNATRRQLLDHLYFRDGQRPGELVPHFGMSHQGLLKHLGVLEQAGLVVAKRSAGKTVHHLNPAPLIRVHAQWMGKFTRSFAVWIDGG